MKNYLTIIAFTALSCFTSCTKDEEPFNRLENEEISRRIIKPNSNEIPVTRPATLSRIDARKEIGGRLRSYSWKLFRKFYNERQEKGTADQNLLFSPYNILTSMNKQVDDSNKNELFDEIGLYGIPEDVLDELLQFIGTYFPLDNRIWFNNTASSPFFRGYWRHIGKVHTQQESFRKADGSTKQMEMMIIPNTLCYAKRSKNYFLAELEIGDYIRMFFVIPSHGHDFSEVIETFDFSDVGTDTYWLLNFMMPKISVEDSISMDLPLSKELISVRQNVELNLSERGVNYASETRNEHKEDVENWQGVDFFSLNQPFLYGIMEKFNNIPLYIGYYGY